jgi:2-oxoglutarate decarboxylase
VEQLYPFAASQATDLLAGYSPTAEAVWAQEEPRNMGPWRVLREAIQPARGAVREAAGERQSRHRIGQAAPAGAGRNRQRWR